MQLLKTNKNEGYARIEIETDDDLWRLKDFFQEGDKIRTLTQRTKLDGREKKTLRLTLEVEKTSYENDRLRVTGEITEASDDVELGYHTFNFEPGTEFEIWRDFSREDWNRLEEMESKHSYQVLFCLIEKGSADFYMVEESGVKDLSKVRDNIPGKMYDDQDTGESFYEDVKNVLERSSRDTDAVILCGPGFEKNKIYELLSEETEENTFLQDTSVTGRTGLNEAIKRGALEKVVEASRIDEETREVEEFLGELKSEGEVSYGEPVKELAEMGAVEKLLLTAEKYRDEKELRENVENQGGEVVMVHTDHEPGKRLEKFGGIGAFLRYQPQS